MLSHDGTEDDSESETCTSSTEANNSVKKKTNPNVTWEKETSKHKDDACIKRMIFKTVRRKNFSC